MSKLMETTDIFLRAISKKEPIEERVEIEITYRFIEVLTFSSKSDILEMLDYHLGKDFLGLPVWVRNLAFRLACLQDSADKDLKRRAGYDLTSFGPNWDGEAERLIEESK